MPIIIATNNSYLSVAISIHNVSVMSSNVSLINGEIKADALKVIAITSSVTTIEITICLKAPTILVFAASNACQLRFVQE